MAVPTENNRPIPTVPGTYALLLRSTTAARVRIGRLGIIDLRPGYYVYIGSAFGPGGLRARISHHQRIAQHPHWHIDYLRSHARLAEVLYVCNSRCEHEWAALIAAVPGAVIPMPGFGSSDCHCLAHLFRLRTSDGRDPRAPKARISTRSTSPLVPAESSSWFTVQEALGVIDEFMRC